ncbi:hypothetical protein CRX69_12260 [Pseudomonas rhizophila]|uniref:Uncharacterized protein n=1 Tax=Pseudomonas rhizophila TaxID=2045200 RepID=A0ABN5JU41_9PSED|nr:hypothetical protein CRX69_12260 [Pseudomonas rhizophila]
MHAKGAGFCIQRRAEHRSCGQEILRNGASLWEQSLLAKQAPRYQKDRIVSIAGKPCSHSGLPWPHESLLATDAVARLKISSTQSDQHE